MALEKRNILSNINGIDVLDLSKEKKVELIKNASIDKLEQPDLNGFDIHTAIKEHPESLFVKVFAIKENEVNDNGDYFSAEELKKAAHTFIGVPVFVNHQNSDIEKARGNVVHAWYDAKAGGIFTINRVDKKAYPQLARGIEEKYVIGTSMGCSVSHSVCNICHKKASTQEDFCSHVKERKNKKFNGKHECKYHDSPGKPEDPCPICGKKKGESKTLEHKEAKVFEYNYDIKFIEDSFVVNPACHDCLVCDVLNLDKISSHINHLSEQRDCLVRAANNNVTIKTSGQKQIDVINNAINKLINIVELMKSSNINNEEDNFKTAGQKEITHINEAINRLDIVARSMMAQKSKVQLDYVSDIVEAMADIQTTLDELTQMGYAQLPSPSEEEIAFGTKDLLSAAADVSASSQSQNLQPQPSQSSTTVQGAPQTNPPPSQPSMNYNTNNTFNPQSGSLGSDLGTVTKPSFSAAASIYGEEFMKRANNIKDDLHKIQDVIKDFSQKDIVSDRFENNLGSDKYSKICESSNDDYKVIITSRQDGEIKIAEFKDDKLIRVSNSDIFDKEIQLRLVNEPQKVADLILQQLKKESDSNMGSQEKIAANNDSSQVNVTTEAQLENSKNPIAARTDSVYEGITESKEQLGGKEKKNDTTSASPQVRKEATYETITEDQLSSIKDGFVVRWADFPEVITEGQWEEVNRAVGAVLPSDWNETVTQKQLASLRDNHSWVDPEFITEKQMSEHKSDISRQASSKNVKSILKAAMSAISDSIAYYGLTPSQIQNSIARMSSSPYAQIKSSRMVLLNSVPRVLEARKNEISRRQYFAKVASKDSSFNPIDGIICSMADNIGYLNANDMVEAMKFASTDSKVMKKAEQEAVEKINSKSADSHAPQNMFDLFKQTFAEMEKSDDGIYKVCGSIKDDLDFSDTSDRTRFIQSVEKFAFAQIPSEGVVTNIDVDEDYGVFEATVKEHRVLSAEEKDALNKVASKEKESSKIESNNSINRSANRKNILKEAQMMGGQLGGGMGGGGTPPPGPAPSPAANTPPVESFTEENTDPLDEGNDDGDMSSKPPGSVCPACGSEDVDVAGGKSHCNNCGLDFVVKIDIEALNWPGIIDDGQGETNEKKENEKGLSGGGNGEGFPMPSKEEPASIPVAASTKLTKNVMTKLASIDTKIGDISPITGSKNTIRLSDNEFMCLDTGHRYSVALKGGSKKDDVYAEWRWIDKSASSLDCDSCHKQKELFVKALNNAGISESDFDLSSAMDKAKIILSMQENGLLKQIKTANKNSSVLAAFKTAYSIDKEKFPMESCIEKLARRFGENAVAISGPCEGSNLADCVCNKLKTAGFYSDKLANKVASIWSDQDGTVECWEDYIRSGLSAKQAATTCEQLRRKYSQSEHLLADELGEDVGDTSSNDGSDMNDGDIDVSIEFQGDDLLNPETDPFSDVNIEKNPDISLDILEALKNLNESIISHLEKDSNEEKVEELDSAGSEGSSVDSIDTDTNISDTEIPSSNSAVDVNTNDSTVDESPVGEVSDNVSGEEIEETPVEEKEEHTETLTDVPSEDSVNDSVEDDNIPKESDTSIDDIVEEKPSTENEKKDNNCDCPCSEKSEEDDDSQKGNLMEKEGLEDKMASSDDRILEDAYALRRGKIVGNHKVNLDVSSILNVLNKKADQSTLKNKNVQDDKDISPISNGSTMGSEEKFKADKPKVPEAGKSALLGKEDAKLHPGDSKATVFTGKAEMGKEKEVGYTSEKTDEQTGGDLGAGNSKSASTKNITNNLADRISAARTKIASEKKIDQPKPVSEDPDLGKIFTEKNDKKVDIPEKGEGSFMGHEKEVLESVPDSKNSAPSIPVGGDNKEKNYDAEKQTHVKGTVIAGSDQKTYLERKNEATKLAGRMIESGLIGSNQLMSKIAELERYDVSQIKDLEKAMFENNSSQKIRKGLETVANGSEKTVVIAESSKFNNNPESELKNKLQSLFRLQKEVDFASSDPINELKR